MTRNLLCSLLMLSLPFAHSAEPTPFKDAARKVSVLIPHGWQKMPEVQKSTVLRVARQGSAMNVARMTVMIYDLPANVPAGYDIWTMPDKEIQAGGESDSKTVLKFGRAEIDGNHMVWSLGRKTMPNGLTLWQLTYEGIRGPEGVTVQLTAIGEESWFSANEVVFAEFVKTLRLSAD